MLASLTPIRALIESSFGISATPGMPSLTGRAMPSARRAAMNVAIAFGVEAQLRRHVLHERRLVAQRLEERRVRDVRVALRVARAPDLRSGAGRARPSPAAARARRGTRRARPRRRRRRTPGRCRPREGGASSVGEVRAVADHPRREVRDRAQARPLELHRQVDRRLDGLRRRGGHGDRRARRQRGGLLPDVLERNQLERRVGEDAPQRGGGLGVQRPRAGEERHQARAATRRPSRGRPPCALR